MGAILHLLISVKFLKWKNSFLQFFKIIFGKIDITFETASKFGWYRETKAQFKLKYWYVICKQKIYYYF